jgi:hypothetical protein
MDEDLAGHLARVERKLDAIQSNTRTTWRELLLAGLLRGVGVVVGGALAIVLVGWGLAVLGIIPGAEDIAEYLAQVFENVAETPL